MTRVRLLLMALLVVVTLGACDKKGPENKGGAAGDTGTAATGTTGGGTTTESGDASVESITLAKDNGGQKGDEVESLAASDQTFHAVVHMDEVGSGAKVKVDLIAVETSEGKNVPVLSKDYDLGGIENEVTVTYTLPRPWPAGKYRIDAYVNGKLSKSKDFEITA